MFIPEAHSTENNGTVASCTKRCKKNVFKWVAAVMLTMAFIGTFGFFLTPDFLLSSLTSPERTAQLLTGNASSNPDITMVSNTNVSKKLERDFYMLLLGVDASDSRRDGEEREDFVKEQGGDFRSDAIMLAHVNLDSNHVTLCSFDRDLKSIITGHEDLGYRKLNAAYELGGVDTMKAEVEEITGVDIAHVVVIDMTALTTLVDSIGGIDVDIEEAFWDEQLQDGFEESGMQHLTGAQALLYSRARHAFEDGTVSRTRHQRQVLLAIVKKLKETDMVTVYMSLAGVSGDFATDLSVDQIRQLGTALKGVDLEENVQMLQSPTVGCEDGEFWFGFMLRDDWKEMIARLEDNNGQAPSEKHLKKVSIETDAVFADESKHFKGVTSADQL